MTAHETIFAAFALASSNHQDEARTLLRGSPAALETEEGLDLLARIELSFGNEDEARRLWTLAGDSRSHRALDALDSVEWQHRRIIRSIRTGFPVLILASTFFFLGRSCTVSLPTRQEASKTTDLLNISDSSPTNQTDKLTSFSKTSH